MEQNEKLTSTNIRYLLAIKSLADINQAVRNIYLANYLHYKKPSIHYMIKQLESIGMIQKADDNIICLTEKGADTAFRYQMYYSCLERMLEQYFPEFKESENAILALLAEIPEQELEKHLHEMAESE